MFKAPGGVPSRSEEARKAMPSGMAEADIAEKEWDIVNRLQTRLTEAGGLWPSRRSKSSRNPVMSHEGCGDTWDQSRRVLDHIFQSHR